MRVLAAALCALMSMRCATALHHELQEVPVSSTPERADVLLDCGRGASSVGRTPMTVLLRRRDAGCSITLSRDGWYDAHVAFHRIPSAAALTNVVPALVAGAVVANSNIDFSAQNNSGAGNPAVSVSASGYGSVAPAAVAGVVFTGGLLIDLGSGALFAQSPSRVEVTLQKK